MGCDIHAYLERKTWKRDRDEWIDMNYWEYNSYAKEYDEESYENVEFYGGRNYELFTILAGVRSRGNNKTICEPKGFPEDASELIKRDYDGWGCDAHSASYFTLKELLGFYEENKGAKYSGMIDTETAKNLDEDGILPDSWCQGTNNKSYVWREWQVESPLKYFIDTIIKRVREVFRIYDFYSEEEVVKKIKEISEEVRVVFWFDN